MPKSERAECIDCPDGVDRGNYIWCRAYGDKLYFDKAGKLIDIKHTRDIEI